MVVAFCCRGETRHYYVCVYSILRLLLSLCVSCVSVLYSLRQFEEGQKIIEYSIAAQQQHLLLPPASKSQTLMDKFVDDGKLVQLLGRGVVCVCFSLSCLCAARRSRVIQFADTEREGGEERGH